MDISESTPEEDVTQVLDRLIESTHEAERRLESSGERDAHAWMFGLREFLLDLRRVLPAIASLPSAAERGTAKEQVRELAADLVYGVAPHVIHHLGEVLELIDIRDADSSQT